MIRALPRALQNVRFRRPQPPRLRYLARTYEEWSGNLDEAVHWLKQGLAKANAITFY